MKVLNTVLMAFIGLFLVSNAFAQAKPATAIQDPTHWSYEVKKKNANEYELIFHLTLQDGWHIWSEHPGGDGFIIPPSFKFDKNPFVHLDGDVVEEGNPIVGKVEGVDGQVTYYKNKVDYVQVVQVKGAATLTGTHEYQVCNDQMCLPPKTAKFRFEVK